MNKLFRVITLLLLLPLALINYVNAQDAVFSQYYSSSLYISPCFAGVSPNTTIGVTTRTQWKSITAPYVTHQLSIIKPFYKSGLTDHNRGGVGLSIYQDKAGDFGYQSLGVNLSGAYNVKISHTHSLTLGLMMGMIQKQINLESLEWGSQFNQFKGFDASFPADQIQSGGALSGRKTMLDIGSGFLYYINKAREKREKGGSLWFGYSAYHLNRPNESLVSGYNSKLQMVSKGILGFEFTLGSRFNISPNILAVRQGSDLPNLKGLNNIQFNGGVYITYMFVEPESDMMPKEILIGGWYRVGDSYIPMLGIVANTYSIGFSYDLNQSGLKTLSNGKGAWEVSLKIEIPRKEKVKRYHNPIM